MFAGAYERLYHKLRSSLDGREMKNKVSEILNIIGIYCKKNWYLIFLLIVALLSRGWYVTHHAFAFSFDHGKDALNVLEMWLHKTPKLVGPWTSIPGLYFGPAWYYFLLGCYLVGGWSPAAAVWGMVILALVQIVLVYHFFGKTAATIVTAGTLWLTVSTSAWNPFPLTLVSWGLMILLHYSARDKKLTWQRALLFGLLASLGFHFSSAYAIFYPIIILICWLIERLIINIKVIFWTALGFVLPFVPQLLFEMRHDWLETRAVIAYVTQGGDKDDTLGWVRVSEVVSKSVGEIKTAVLPDLYWPGFTSFLTLLIVVSLLLGVGVFAWKIIRRQSKLPELAAEALVFIVVPLLGFCFLHFNLWYLLGMMPAAVILVAGVIDAQNQSWQWCWRALYLVGLVTVLAREFWWQDVTKIDVHYHQLETVWARVLAESAGQPIRVYVYEPWIYDFAWQYEILRRALVRGEVLPVEFAYQPGEIVYVPGKQEWLERLPLPEASAAATFYILHNPQEDNDFFSRWRGQNPDFARAEYLETVGENLQIWRAQASGEAQIQI